MDGRTFTFLELQSELNIILQELKYVYIVVYLPANKVSPARCRVSTKLTKSKIISPNNDDVDKLLLRSYEHFFTFTKELIRNDIIPTEV